MKVLLTAINAKYIHSNLAVYCLKSYCKAYENEIEIAEYTINNQVESIIGDIYKRKPDVIAFSCYIWNIEMVREVAVELRKLLPEAKIWMGGPEVSYDAKEVLSSHSFVDGVMVGEGEETLQELMAYYVDQSRELLKIKGLAFKRSAAISCDEKNYEEGAIYYNEPRGLMDLSKVPFPYEDIKKFENKIIYYESSRGCPYSCSYCLSSIDKSVRFRDIKMVKEELQIFLDAKVPQVKFIDRTFNCKHEHSMAIWTYIHEHDNGITNFHFEISADILNDKEMELLNKMRPGLVQLEIGVQSTNPVTIEAIHRTMNLSKLKEHVARVNGANNIHQHLDLIAGLPFETLEVFQNSFDDVYRMKPNQLQLGFLKVLKGSHMHDMSGEYNIVYRSSAPYEVLFTKWLSYDEVLHLKKVEDMVEVYYNSGQFFNAIGYLEKQFESPYRLFESIADYYDRFGYFDRNHSRMGRFEILLSYYKDTFKEGEEAFAEILVYDIYVREKMKSRPPFAKEDLQQYKKLYRDIYETLQKNESFGKQFEQISLKEISKISHIEHFSIDIEAARETGKIVPKSYFVLFDYEKRNPLNHDAKAYDLGELVK